MPDVPSQGRIIEVTVLDPQSRNPKSRPVVIVTPNSEIKPGEIFWGVAITGTLPNPLTEEYVLLPFQPEGQCRSGLRKRCAAKCDWPVQLRHENITRYIGHLRAAEFKKIADYFSSHGPH